MLREKFQLDVVSLIKEIGSHMERKPTFSTSIEVPFSASTKQVLIHTVEEADHLQQPEIEPEHLLLGLLRIADSVPAAILSKHGVSLESVRERLS